MKHSKQQHITPKQTNVISICHGQNCHAVGGKALADKLADSGIDFDIIPCQSLCTYAPTAKVGKIAILHAELDKILDAV